MMAWPGPQSTNPTWWSTQDTELGWVGERSGKKTGRRGNSIKVIGWKGDKGVTTFGGAEGWMEIEMGIMMFWETPHGVLGRAGWHSELAAR